MSSEKQYYYIGTLVPFHIEDEGYEVIDGQNRLTTIYLILKYLNADIGNRLTYRARKKSTKTLESIPEFKVDEKDMGIYNGFQSVKNSVEEVVPQSQTDVFTQYFLDKVRIIHYRVPKDVDLNHYFEVMNSRGEQLEKHEIVKAELLSLLPDSADRAKFNRIWESCSEMSVYIQAKYNDEAVLGKDLAWLRGENFDGWHLPVAEERKLSIDSVLTEGAFVTGTSGAEEKPDSFQPIIDFSNFLLIVLKITRILKEPGFDATEFNLDDKELLNEFSKNKITLNEEFAKEFGYNLLKAKYFLDNYIVHHSSEEDTLEYNPWKLQYWQKEPGKKQVEV